MKELSNSMIMSVVTQDLCVGCGACVYNNEETLKMDWNNEGFLVPSLITNTQSHSDNAIKVCPFNPNPEDKVRTENELADIFLKEAPNSHPKVGKYYNTYAGYSEQFRLTSSSGGLATYILTELFERKMIDAVITVGEGKEEHYKYKLVRSKEELLATSKTKYYPVTMADALNELKSFEGKVAVVGIGCFIKAVRLLQYYNPELKDKIVFTVGIICGGLKSKFFGEYLAAKAGVKDNEFTKPQFRIKDYDSNAGDYSFGCLDKSGAEKQVRMRTVGDMWGSGMFKCNACDFCDDVTTELADISLGDAWIQPYQKDGKGTNVVITRSELAENLILEGKKNNKLSINPIGVEIFLKSQLSSFYHRHNALNYRIKKSNIKTYIPPKRHDKYKIYFDFMLVQLQRYKVRKKSLSLWKELKDVDLFEHKIRKSTYLLKKTTYFYHVCRKLRISLFKLNQ